MYVYGQSYIQELSQVLFGLCEALKCCNPSCVIRRDKMLWINLVGKYGMVSGVKTLKGLCDKIMTFPFLIAVEKNWWEKEFVHSRTTAEISNPAPGATALKISAPPQSNTPEPPNQGNLIITDRCDRVGLVWKSAGR